MGKYCFDIEIFPNFFCATFVNPENEKDKETFIIFDGYMDERDALINFISQNHLFIGFNNLHFDSVVLWFIVKNVDLPNLANECYRVGQDLIHLENRVNSDTQAYKYAEKSWQDMDLMKILAFDKLGVSLKQTAINLKWHKIQDLPLPYDKVIERSDVQLILDYNLNDVLITIQLYKRIADIINLRKELSTLFGVDLTNASDSKMANIILEYYYTQETGIDAKSLKNLRTKHTQLVLGYCLGKGIEFKTNILRKLKSAIDKTLVRESAGFSYKKKVNFGGITYQLGIGGLHSEDDERMFCSDDKYIVRDCDVSSYYPFIILNNRIKPAHLGDDFVDILEKITYERISAKKNGQKIRADGLKITINSIFGKLGSNTFWLEDAQAMLSVTLSGQLYLLMLIEDFVLSGIRVISANTDGVVCKIPRELENKYYEICKNWQEKTSFGLEFTDYSLYVRNDVNNYVTQKTDGKTKEKGRYIREIDLKKGYKHPIVPKALYQYFINGISVRETIEASQDIFDFCVSQKTGSDFILEYRRPDREPIKLQKNNRFYISKSGGSLVKIHQLRGNEIGLFIGKTVKILNDYDERIPFSEYDIDYDFYEEEANKYISKVVQDADEPFIFVDDDSEFVDEAEEVNEEERERLMMKIEGMKGLSNNVVNNLLTLEREFQGTNFFDFLVFAEDKGMVSTKFEYLIRIGFFDKFNGGNKKQLLMFAEFRNGKNKYTNKLSEKSKIKRLQELANYWLSLPDENLSVKEQLDADITILGRIKSVFPELDARYVYVKRTEMKYSPKVEVYCLKKGTTGTMKIRRAIFDQDEILSGDIIWCSKIEKKHAVRKTDDGWQDIPDKFDWWLNDYRVVTNADSLLSKE